MAIRFHAVLPLTALAALLASGAAFAGSAQSGEPALKPLTPFTATGSRIGPRDPYTDGGASTQATEDLLQARIGPRDPYTDGGRADSRGPRPADPYTDGQAA